MTNIDRPEPLVSHDDSLDFLHIYFHDCRVIAVVNKPGLASLVWAFWFLAVECPFQDPITLSSSEDIPEPPEGEYLSSCSITMIEEGTMPVGLSMHQADAAEIFLVRSQAEAAFDAINRFSQTCSDDMDEIELLGKFVVRVVDI